MGPTNNIGYLLQHLSGVLSKRYDQSLQERLEIGFSQFKLLMVLQSNPSLQQRKVAQWLGQTEASISRQIKLMVDKGLLDSTVSPNNRREHLTTLTDKGLRVAEDSMKVLNNCHSEVFAKLGDKGQSQLLNTLSEMHISTCNSNDVGACSHPFNS